MDLNYDSQVEYHAYLLITQACVAEMCHNMTGLSADKSNLEKKLASEEVERRHTYGIQLPCHCIISEMYSLKMFSSAVF